MNNEEMSTPILYKLDSKGVTRVWRAWTELQEDGSAIENNESGIEGGKLSGIPITLLVGKNIGKANETTPIQQANLNIQSKFNAKLKEGYVLDLSEFTQQGVMKALHWSTSSHRMPEIAFHQPKLDGIRCKIHVNSSGQIQMMSKKNTEFKPFIYETPFARFFAEHLTTDSDVDGEMYIHGVDFNDIQSLVMSYKLSQGEFLDLCEDTDEGLRVNMKAKDIVDLVHIGNFQPEFGTVEVSPGVFKKTTSIAEDFHAIEIGRNKGWIFPGFTKNDIQVIGTNDLQFWMFDAPDRESVYETRNEYIRSHWMSLDLEGNSVVPVLGVEFSKSDIESVNDEYVAQGFEGTMVRSPSALYSFGDSSAGLLKFKLFYDAEWYITGHSLDREGNPTFTFVSDAGYEFSCRPTGNRAWRCKLLECAEDLIGLKGTLRYQRLHPETLCPQFARMISVRNYE